MAPSHPRRPRSARPLAALATAVLVALPVTLCWCSAGSSPLARLGQGRSSRGSVERYQGRQGGPVAPGATWDGAIVPGAPWSASSGVVGDGGVTPLMLAANNDESAGIKAYAEAGADLDHVDGYGWSALRYAIRKNKIKAAEALIEGGANVNLASFTGRTPLMSAAGNGLSAGVRLLLAKGADPKLTDQNGQTAFDIASRGGITACQKCVELLKLA